MTFSIRAALAALPLLAAAAGAQVVPDSAKRAAVPLPDSAVVPPPRSVRICAGGDVTLGTNLDRSWARMAAKRLRDTYALSDHPDSLIAPLRPLVADADIVLLNVEGAIGEGPAPSKCGRGSSNCYAFRQPISAAQALRTVAESAVVVGNVANNHSRDAGPEGHRATLRHLRRAGVHVTGADTIATPVVTRSGDTVAFLGFYTSPETPDARDLEGVRRHVARAVERWGTVVVTMHLGAEGAGAQRTRNQREIFLGRIDRGNPVAFADAAIGAGATLVIGHGPHVLRAAEWRDDRLVVYSLGNLLTYGPFGNKEPTNRGAVACATIDSAGFVSRAELRPTVQLAPGVLRPDSTARAAWLVDSLSAIDFPSSGARLAMDGRLTRRTVVQRDSLSRPADVASPPSRTSPEAPQPRASSPPRTRLRQDGRP